VKLRRQCVICVIASFRHTDRGQLDSRDRTRETSSSLRHLRHFVIPIEEKCLVGDLNDARHGPQLQTPPWDGIEKGTVPVLDYTQRATRRSFAIGDGIQAGESDYNFVRKSASLELPSATQVELLAIPPSARSTLRRRSDSSEL
jgi:hypothetical protein